MGKPALILSNIATALVVCAATSAFWISAYGNGREQDATAPARSAEPAAPARVPPTIKVRPEDIELAPSGLVIPVAGVAAADLVDTYKQARAGGARVHDAIDIMAPHGTPVVAAAPGKIEKLFFSKGGGGITAYVRSPDRAHIFYYAHLQSYAPGLKEGQVVKQGDPIGLVGVTGNSAPDGPHLHFAIHRLAPGEDWHEGTPLNPYPMLAGVPRKP